MTILSSDIVGYPRISSDYPRIMVESSFYWRKHFRDFPRKSWPSRFRGRRSIWWGWRVTWLAPRIGNDVSYVTQTIDDIDFVWQVQYLVRLEGHFVWQAHYLVRLACCILQYKIVSKLGRVRSPKRRVRDDDFILGYPRISSDYPRIMVESSFYWRKHFRDFPRKSWPSRFRGRRSIWWGWRVTWLAPRIGNDVSYVTQITDDMDFVWQVQYLVRLGGDLTGFTHWKWGFICDADHRWHWFCVAGAVFGEVGGWLDLLHALEMSFHMWRRSSMTFILRGRRSIWWGWRVTWLAPRIGNDVSYVTQITDDMDFVWQVQYLVRLGGDLTGFTHWKWGFICDADHRWHWFCVAGAVFGEVGGWLDLLHLLEMSFHMWRRSSMTFILRGRRSIWWGWRVTWLAPRIGNDVSYVTQITDDMDFVWQAQYLVKLDGDSCCAAQYRVVLA